MSSTKNCESYECEEPAAYCCLRGSSSQRLCSTHLLQILGSDPAEVSYQTLHSHIRSFNSPIKTPRESSSYFKAQLLQRKKASPLQTLIYQIQKRSSASCAEVETQAMTQGLSQVLETPYFHGDHQSSTLTEVSQLKPQPFDGSIVNLVQCRLHPVTSAAAQDLTAKLLKATGFFYSLLKALHRKDAGRSTIWGRLLRPNQAGPVSIKLYIQDMNLATSTSKTFIDSDSSLMPWYMGNEPSISAVTLSLSVDTATTETATFLQPLESPKPSLSSQDGWYLQGALVG